MSEVENRHEIGRDRLRELQSPAVVAAGKVARWFREDICDRWRKWNWWLRISVLITAAGMVMFLWFFCRGYLLKGYTDPGAYISSENVGQLGDIIGGSSGVLFSLAGVLLLIETLRRQRVEMVESQYVNTVQRFNDLFFHIIALYESAVESLGGKQFFTGEFAKLYNISKADGSHKRAKEEYLEFYTNHSMAIAHYFRLLYRIFNLLEDSGLKDKDRVKYAKIVRGQLSEAELFFLYYNAMTGKGRNFRKYINKYNLLKHLPVLDKLEFKNHNMKLNTPEMQQVNDALYELKGDLRDFLRESLDDSLLHRRTMAHGYIMRELYVEAKRQEDYELTVDVRIPIIVEDGKRRWRPFARLMEDDARQLLQDFLYDTFVYSGFYQLNNRQTQVVGDIDSRSDKSTRISFIISNLSGNPLRLPGCR